MTKTIDARVELPEKVSKKLDELAKRDGRSKRKYIIAKLQELAEKGEAKA